MMQGEGNKEEGWGYMQLIYMSSSAQGGRDLLIHNNYGLYSLCLLIFVIAEKLSILLYVCVFNYYAMHIRVCILLGQPQENNEHT